MLTFYYGWFFSTILFNMFFGYTLLGVIGQFILSTSSLINGFTLVYITIDYILISKKGILKGWEKHRVFIGLGATILLGLIFLGIFKENIFSIIADFANRFLHPFNIDRTGFTVAENAQTFLVDWIDQTGKFIFWLFYLGTVLFGIEISKGIEKKKNKILFFVFWAFLVSSILFSRISPTSIFNGTNFLGKLFYFTGLISFALCSLWIYIKDNMKIKPEIAIVAAWAVFMLISGRGAVRFFFFITPFMVFMASFFVVKTFEYARKNKDDFGKMALYLILAISIIGMIISSIGIPFNSNSSGFYQESLQQAKQTGPSANYQWQHAMEWVRNNTVVGSIFVHWWDYGYWVQYLGQRPTVTDGGHAVGYWDHLIGRYLLTTPNPETALSFMKTQNVSYLLIDPTDLGKYPAYSKIGSDDSGTDRYSQIPIMPINPSQTQTTENLTTRIYQGGVQVDEDILYKIDDIFLPENKAIMAGVILKQTTDTGLFSQPVVAYIYNQKQFNIPARYLYYNHHMYDFGGGLNVTIVLFPMVSQDSATQQIHVDQVGSAIYLSPKVSKSLFAQLYLLDDYFGNYKTLTLAHSEPDPVVSSLNSQGANIGDFVYFGGFRGPIKIWKVNYPSNTATNEEFYKLIL